MSTQKNKHYHVTLNNQACQKKWRIRSAMQQFASSPINAPHIALPLQHETMENTPERKGRSKKDIPSNTIHAGRTHEFVTFQDTIRSQSCVSTRPKEASSMQNNSETLWPQSAQLSSFFPGKHQVDKTCSLNNLSFLQVKQRQTIPSYRKEVRILKPSY